MISDEKRRHSVFGDYILVEKKCSPDSVLGENTVSEMRDYNTLWIRYAKTVNIWGGIPTKKGFDEWLANKSKEAEYRIEKEEGNDRK